ncbi:HET-domain-containing protein [Hypoxylon sp. FL1857]|nr:HET-domain-containing protein [Hypoxylon sp. FL1857]
MVRYRYSPLPGRDYIRVATLHPGEFDDDIVVSFDTLPFPGDGSLRYEALSYAWGSKKDPLPVYVNMRRITTTGPLQNSCRTTLPQILATKNLVIALRHLRYVDKPRLVWVDALCIHQADDAEKGPQVAMMGEIFRLAHRVVAWLGPEENDSNHAMELTDYLGAEVDVDFATGSLSPAEGCTDPSLGDQKIDLPFDERYFFSIHHLISRHWFDRLWIRQEIYLANSEAIIMCGFRRVKWTSFRRGLACLYRKSGVLSVGITVSQINSRRRALRGLIFQSGTTGLRNLRRQYDYSHCADPRDRIYAILSFLPEWEMALIPRPDYSRPYNDLYEQVTIQYIKCYGGLNILCQCEPQDSTSCPSWVPNWSKPAAFATAIRLQSASSQLGAWYDFPERGVLKAVGVPETKVEKYCQFPHFENLDSRSIFEEIRRVLLNMHSEERYTVEDYARIITLGDFAESYDPPDYGWPDIYAVKRVVKLMISDRYQFTWDDFLASSAYISVLNGAWVISGTRLVLTTNGYLGIAPASTEPGDMVCVILGCDLPLLLRPLGNDKFKLVGPCFVPSLNHGEALLGPLPENIQVVYLGYKDVLSGEISREDPRLKSLPVDLTDFHRHLSQKPGAVIHVEPEILREHGVDLTYFDII